MATLASPDAARRRARLLDRRRRAIVHEAGPGHPEFGHAFMRYYLPHYCSVESRWVEPAEWHDQFFRAVFGSLGTGEMHVHEAFRGGAKSTTATLGVPLAALGLQLKRYVWIVQDTAPQAKQSMEAILGETESNPRVRSDFPHLVPQLGKHNRPIADRDDDVVFASSQRLQAMGAGQKLRGRRHRQHRPDLAIVDDLENDESVLTKYQRDKLDSWFSSALLGALGPKADLHLLGTPLHSDALLRRLPKRVGFRSHRYVAAREWAQCACVEGYEPPEDADYLGDPDCQVCDGLGFLGVPTWPSYWPLERLARTRARMGATPFSREYLLVATDEGRKRFPRRFFQYGDRPVPTDGKGVSVRIGVDPAIGQKRENDRSAIVAAMKKKGERRFHIDRTWADRVRGTKLKEQALSMYAYYRELGYNPVVVFEKVQAQAWGAEALEDEGVAVNPVTPQNDKLVRAEPVSVHYEEGRVTHAEGLRDGDFENELDEFPDGEHDDYVDAMVYAILDLSGPESGGGMTGAVDHSPKKGVAKPGLPKGVGALPDDPRFG